MYSSMSSVEGSNEKVSPPFMQVFNISSLCGEISAEMSGELTPLVTELIYV